MNKFKNITRKWYLVNLVSIPIERPTDTALTGLSKKEQANYLRGTNSTTNIMWLACQRISQPKPFCPILSLYKTPFPNFSRRKQRFSSSGRPPFVETGDPYHM